MKHAVSFTLFFVLLYSIAYSQTGLKRTIRGSIVDDNNVAIPFANAAVYSSLDSTLVGGAASDENGKFAVEIQPGNYYLEISFLSYQPQIIPNVNVVNQDLEIGTIVLEADTRLLETVEIEGERSQMVLELDKRVFNVGTDLSSSGGNAADILNNVPSVNV